MNEDQYYPYGTFPAKDLNVEGYTPLKDFAMQVYKALLKTLNTFGHKPDYDEPEAKLDFERAFTNQIFSMIEKNAIVDFKTGEVFVHCGNIVNDGDLIADTLLWNSAKNLEARPLISYTKMICCMDITTMSQEEAFIMVVDDLKKNFWPIIKGGEVLNRAKQSKGTKHHRQPD